MWLFEPTPLEGAFVITLPKFDDTRGNFVKTFQSSVLRQNYIDFDLAESYYSVSHKNVIRGMHFQLPPYDHSKIVFCLHGSILDVLVDLRKDSNTYGQHFEQVLSADNHKAFYIPKGFAHGFKSLEDNTITYYLVSSEHNTSADAGIHYDSFGMDWGKEIAILSERDQKFVTLSNFESPF